MKVEATRPELLFTPVEVRFLLEAPEEAQAVLALFGGLNSGDIQLAIRRSKRAGAVPAYAAGLCSQLYLQIAKAMGTD